MKDYFVSNRSVNTLGGKGKNNAMDLNMEHSNQFLRPCIKNLGPDVTENAVDRICHAEAATQMLTATINQKIEKVSLSGRHTVPQFNGKRCPGTTGEPPVSGHPWDQKNCPLKRGVRL